MLTGDKKENADNFASSLGIEDYHYELLPQDKTKYLEECIDKKEGVVAFIGDGINDAPSITLADVGVAMGGAGSDLAIETADVVIMNDDPSKILTTLDISRKVRGHVLFNIIFSILVKITIMVLSVSLPSFPLIVAVLSDTGLTMLLILLTIGLLHEKPKK